MELEVRPVGRGARERGGFSAAPRTHPLPNAASAGSLLRAWGVPGAPGSCSQLSLPTPASVGSGLRACRAPPTSPAPWTAHPVAPSTAPDSASCLCSPPADIFFSGCHSPALYPLSSQPWLTPLVRGGNFPPRLV